MPEDDVSDLRDVVDAINKLCDTMKTSYDESIDTVTDCDSANSVDFDSQIDAVECDSQNDTVDSDSPNETSSIFLQCNRYVRPVAPSNSSSNVPEYNSPAPQYECQVEAVTIDNDEVDVQDTQYTEYRDVGWVSPEEVTVQKVEVYKAERWSDSQTSLQGPVEDVETVTSDTDPAMAQHEPASEMYYTASSEVSLLSDTELPEKVQNEEKLQSEEDKAKDDRCVISGHVAAMRERFESMTRTNTPCPDLVRSLSPSLEVFRNMSPSPDTLA